MDREPEISIEDSDGSDSLKGSNIRFEKMLKFLLKERKNSERALLLKDKTDGSDPPPPPPPPSSRRQPQLGAAVNGGINPYNKCIIHPHLPHFT